MSEQTAHGWVIERGSDPPEWWTGKHADDWTADATNALRFARYEDAERARCYLVAPLGRACKSTNQVFLRSHGCGVVT